MENYRRVISRRYLPQGSPRNTFGEASELALTAATTPMNRNEFWSSEVTNSWRTSPLDLVASADEASKDFLNVFALRCRTRPRPDIFLVCLFFIADQFQKKRLPLYVDFNELIIDVDEQLRLSSCNATSGSPDWVSLAKLRINETVSICVVHRLQREDICVLVYSEFRNSCISLH